MDRNIRIAKELVKLAKDIVAMDLDDADQSPETLKDDSNFINGCRNAMKKFVDEVEKHGWKFEYTSSGIYDYDDDHNADWSYGIDVMFSNPKMKELSDSEREKFLESETKKIEGIFRGKKYKIIDNENIEVSGVYSYVANDGDAGDERLLIAIDRRRSFNDFDSLWHDFLSDRQETDEF